MREGIAVARNPANAMPAAWLSAAGAVCAVTALEAFALEPLWHPQPVLAVLNLATLAAFMITGLLLKGESGQRLTGWALVLAGIFHPLGLLNWWNTGPMPLYASLFGYLDEIFGAWALLRYPNRRLQHLQRVFLATLSAWLIGGPAFLAVISRPGWQQASPSVWWPAWLPDRRVWMTSTMVFDVGAVMLAVAFIALLLLRFSQAKGLDRIIITPVLVAAAVSAIAAATTVTGLLFSESGDDLFTFESAAELVVPLSFLVSVAQRRIARGQLAVELASEETETARSVQDMLRRVLHDPELSICYWVPARQAFLDGAGTPASRGAPSPGQLSVPITGSDGQPLAVIQASDSTARDRPLLDGALSASRMALENARLQAELRSQLQEVRESRARIVDAGLAERRLLERNLHDGAQQRLLGLVAQVEAARVTTTDPSALISLELFSAELLSALRELRELARGILPAVLEQSGIGAAAEGVIERLPVPARLEVTAGRLPPAVEATAYFVISEALANTVRHAQARSAAVRVWQEDAMLIVQVDDDGRGGADPGGRGLAGLSDRVTTLGGQLVIESQLGLGTHLTASIPCA